MNISFLDSCHTHTLRRPLQELGQLGCQNLFLLVRILFFLLRKALQGVYHKHSDTERLSPVIPSSC